jgi:PAS domain S-box-containing protein
LLTFLASPDVYRALLDSMTEGVSLSDESGAIVYTNPAEDSLFGYERGELIGRHVSVQNAYPPDENLRRVDDVIAQLKAKGRWEGEWLNRRKDGATFITASRITAVEIENRPHWLCVQRDVTAERDAERRLRDSEARLRLALDAGRMAVFDHDFATDELRHSAELNRLLGFPPERPVRMADVRARFAPGEVDRLRRLRAETLAGGDRFMETEFWMAGAAGGQRCFLLRAETRTDEAGREVGSTGIILDVTERKLAEVRLRESEERLRLAAGAASIGTWDFDLTTGRGEWDETARVIGGMASRDYTGETWAALVHPDDRARALAAFQASLAPGGPPYDIEFRGSVPAEDGGVRWLASHGAVLRDPESQAPSRAIGIVRDITADRRATAALRESEARFRAMVDAVPSIVWFAKQDGELEYFNDRWFALTGQTPEEALPTGWAATLHPDDAERTAREWEHARSRGVAYQNECRYRRKDGAYRWHVARAEPVRDADGRIVRWFGTSTDIHAQKRAVERLELALDAGAIQGTWVWDVPADRVTADERFGHTFGIDPEERRAGFPIQRAVDAIHPEDRARVATSIDAALASGGAYRVEYRARNADDVHRWVEASGRVELAADGSPRRFAGVAVDIEARREAEERERLLAREVDHRAKNLLGVIQSVVQLTRGDDVAELKAAVAGRIQALARAHSLLAAGRWEGVELGALVREELAPFEKPDGSRVRVDGGALRLRPGASQALALAVHELATNAAKYGALSVDEGTVDVSWRQSAPADGKAELELLWIERGGPAVPSTPTRKGFGSTVIRSSIERQLGGALEMDWRSEGLVCRMAVPADQLAENSVAEAEPVREERAMTAAPSLAGRRILVVEDETLIAMQIESVVEALGCEVMGPVATPADALALLRGGTPDGAILDVNLAGVRSDRVAQALTALGVPFLYCTGYADGSDLVAPAGEIERVTKPLDPKLLTQAVTRLLEG